MKISNLMTKLIAIYLRLLNSNTPPDNGDEAEKIKENLQIQCLSAKIRIHNFHKTLVYMTISYLFI